MHFDAFLTHSFLKYLLDWEHLDISPQNGVVISVCFRAKMFSCIITKRTGFEDLVHDVIIFN